MLTMLRKIQHTWHLFYCKFIMSGPTDDDFDQMRSWSISAQLAAVPSGYLEQVPSEVAALIRSAKDLHQEMANGAAARDLSGEPCPPLG